ncbi:FGGY family carbohydrate kinase, partial [Pontimonas sp.]
MNAYMMSLDQGTTSTRAIIFDHSARIVSKSQREHEQILPQAGWVEHNPQEIWDNTREVMGEALSRATLTRHDIAGLGITNQRETAMMWNKSTGELVYNAIVWQDTRTQDVIDRMEAAHGSDYFRKKTGLPLATYFAASKIVWILDNVEGARKAAEAGDLLFGTPDTWLLWNLTGGVGGGVHATDVTNASRTLLMDIATCQWDDGLLDAWGIPSSLLPEIRSSSE